MAEGTGGARFLFHPISDLQQPSQPSKGRVLLQEHMEHKVYPGR